MTKTILILIFQFLIFQYSFSQIFKSNEQYSGTIDEIQDSVLRKEVLAIQDCLNQSKRKNKEVKKIFSSTKDSIFTFEGSGMICFKQENDIYTINRFEVWLKRGYEFPPFAFNDLKIKATESDKYFPCTVFSTNPKSTLFFHCVDAFIDNNSFTVIFVSSSLKGFLGRVLIKSN